MIYKNKHTFKIQYFAVFIFLALMLFMRPDTVFAKVKPVVNNTHTILDVVDLQTGATACQIYATSYRHLPENERQFKIGYKYDIMNSTDGQTAWSNFQSSRDNYSISSLSNLIAYPCIIMFSDRYLGSSYTYYTCTGYLYLYVNSERMKEQASIWASYAGTSEEDSFLPLYYSKNKKQGEAFIGISGFNCFLPISNIKSGNGYYSQNFISKSRGNVDAIETQAQDKLKEIAGKGKQDVNDWSSWNPSTSFVMGNDNYTISGQYKWVTMFAIGAMGEDTLPGGPGVDWYSTNEYAQKKYDVTASTIREGFNAVISACPEAKQVIMGDPSKIDSHNYRGFKNSEQLIGLDSLIPCTPRSVKGYLAQFKTNRMFNGYAKDFDLVNGEEIIQAAWNYISSAGGNGYNILNDKDRTRLSPSQITSAYEQILSAGSYAGAKSNFIQIPGVGNYVSRYSWGATVGMIGAAQDTWFQRDVKPSEPDDASAIIGRKLPGIGSTRLQDFRYTRNFGRYATENWNGLSKTDKVETAIIIIETDPWLVPMIAKKMPKKYPLVAELGTDANAIKKLNKLGQEDYKKWVRTVIQIGDAIVADCSLFSVFPHTGWGAQAAFSDGTYYAIQSFPIFIPVTAPEPYVEDLLVSNSYGTGINTSEDAAYGSVSKSPEARNTIDWTPLVTSGLNLSGLKKGGKSIPEEPTNTVLKKQSQYFDIYCGIRSIPGAGQLAPDTDNIAAVGRSAGGKGTSNNSQIRTYSKNPAQHKFTTVFFVGRIPEADSEVEVKVGDMVPTVFASFNKFDLVWDAGFDDNASGRATISINMSENKGTAQSALSSAIYAFSGDYNGSYLVNNYWAKGLSKSYNEVHNWEFGVTAKPLGILECDQKSLLDYAIPEYMTKGPEATGYSNIKMVGGFKSASESTKVNPGDVVAYTFDYAFPKNQSVLKSNIGRLIEDGTWYTEYETLLMADLNIELLPSKKLKESEWEEINSNTGNDYVKERLVAPVLHNVFFTEIKVDAVGGESFSKTGRPSSDGADYISQTKLTETDFGIPWLVAPAGGRDEFGDSFTSNTIYKHYYDLKPNKSTTNYSLSKVTVKFSWEYVTTLPITSSNINIANQIKYSNGLNRTSGIITGSQIKKDWTGQATDYMGFEYRGNAITVDPNQDILNFGKGNTVTLDVPNSSVNEFHGDWEHIVIAFNAPPKDNSVDDLVLLYNNSQLVGEANINRLNGGGAQAIDYKEGGSYTLYAIVRRNKPDFSWEEKVDGRKWRGDTVGCFEYATNENTASHSKMVSHAETSIPGAARTIPMVIRNITNFKNPGDTLVFKVNLPSNLMYLEATFHYRDAYIGEDSEDIDLENNVWSESWSAKYPDFAVEINQDFKSVFENGSCGSQRTVVPNYTIIATQANPFYEGGGGPVTIETSLGGWTVASGTNNGNNITWFWGGGMEQQTYIITYRERRFPYQSPTFNEEFVFRAHINPEVRYNEKNLNNNYAKANFSVTLDCKPPLRRTSVPPCTSEDWERLGCRYKYGVGKQYRWNVKFRWSQRNPEKTTATNVKPYEHYYTTETNPDGSTYQQLHCGCFCDNDQGAGPNDGVRFWRTEIDGAPLYYEVHTMQIYLKNTNKATNWGGEGASVYDITGGTGYVSGGMMWNVFFDARYDSDRGSMPRAMYSPFSQPYSTPHGGQGCCADCNWLHRAPNPENVIGPRHVLIKYRGLQVVAPKDYEYTSPQQTLANGYVNKHFRWQPISGMMAMTKENTRQTLNISITSYAFTGHIFDTRNSSDGTGYSPPGYAWQSATFHCFCDTVSATVEFIPPRPYIASSVSPSENAQGLDGNAPGKGEKVGNRDTGVEGTDNMETDDDQWMY